MNNIFRSVSIILLLVAIFTQSFFSNISFANIPESQFSSLNLNQVSARSLHQDANNKVVLHNEGSFDDYTHFPDTTESAELVRFQHNIWYALFMRYFIPSYKSIGFKRTVITFVLLFTVVIWIFAQKRGYHLNPLVNNPFTMPLLDIPSERLRVDTVKHIRHVKHKGQTHNSNEVVTYSYHVRASSYDTLQYLYQSANYLLFGNNKSDYYLAKADAHLIHDVSVISTEGLEGGWREDPSKLIFRDTPFENYIQDLEFDLDYANRRNGFYRGVPINTLIQWIDRQPNEVNKVIFVSPDEFISLSRIYQEDERSQKNLTFIMIDPDIFKDPDLRYFFESFNLIYYSFWASYRGDGVFRDENILQSLFFESLKDAEKFNLVYKNTFPLIRILEIRQRLAYGSHTSYLRSA